MDSLMWLKLLFVPALGILILVLFLLEDYCYPAKEFPDLDAPPPAQLTQLNGQANQTNYPTNNGNSTNNASGPLKGRNKRGSMFWRRSNVSKPPGQPTAAPPAQPQPAQPLAQSQTSPAPSLPPHLSAPGTKIFLNSEFGVTCVYKLPASISVRELLAVHCARNNLATEGFAVRMAGQRLAESSIIQAGPESIHLTLELDLAVFSAALDNDAQRESAAMAAAVEKERSAANQLEGELADAIESLVELQAEVESAQTAVTSISQQKAEALAALDLAQQAAAEAKKLRKRREEEQRKVENELIAPQAKERARLEKQVKEAKFAIASANAAIEEANQGIAKKTKEIAAMDLKKKEMNQRIEFLQKEIQREKEKAEKLPALQAAVEALEREKEEILRKQKEVEALEKELEEQEKELSTHKNFLQSTLATGATSAVAAASLSSNNQAELLDQQIAMQKNKHKQLEGAAKELTKWKALAAKFEGEAKEWSKWKLIVKQSKMREKMLEKDLKETGHWRQRAKAFEKELKELRTFKRNAVELSAVKNWNLPPPPVVNENEFENAPVSAYSAVYEAENWPEAASAQAAAMMLASAELKNEQFFDAAPSLNATGGSNSDDALPPVHLAAATAAMSALNADRSSGPLGPRFFSSTLQPSAREFIPRTGINNAGNPFGPSGGNSAFSNSGSAASPTLGPFFPSNWGPGFDSAAPLNAPISSKPGLLIIDDRAESTQQAAPSALAALNASSLELEAFQSAAATSNLGTSNSSPLMNQPAPAGMPGLASLTQLSSQLASVLSALNNPPLQGNPMNGTSLPQ